MNPDVMNSKNFNVNNSFDMFLPKSFRTENYPVLYGQWNEIQISLSNDEKESMIVENLDMHYIGKALTQ